MAFQFHHLDKWAFANLDLIEEALEKRKKAVVLVSGASSSGKSYSVEFLKDLLVKCGHSAYILSLDQYNVGLSSIIPEKVNVNYYDGKLKNLPLIEERIKKIIYDVPFDEKYTKPVLDRIAVEIKDIFADGDLDKFLELLNKEWLVLNFDEPTVYNLKEAANDVRDLLSGKKIKKKLYSKVVSERVESDEYIDGNDYEVILVEGIYALHHTLIDELNDVSCIKDFIDGDPKSLFLRRIIRDAKTTSADNVFTISLYFKYIIKSYFQTINPCRENADVILYNDMTFTEMRAGDLYTTKLEFHTFKEKAYRDILKDSEVIEKVYQKDVYFSVPNENRLYSNILRLRSVSDDGVKYTPSSLVHKGIPKVRKDNQVIRPINVLLKEGEFFKVWNSESECLNDFLSAGFMIGPIRHKLKVKVNYHGQRLTIRKVRDDGYYIEFSTPPNEEVLESIKKIIL